MQVPMAHYWCVLAQTEEAPKVPYDVSVKSVGSFGDGVWWMTFEVPMFWRVEDMRERLRWYGYDVLDIGLQKPYPWFSNAGIIETGVDARRIHANFRRWYVHNWYAHRAEILARQNIE